MRRIWETPGGIHPAENKAQSTGEPIGKIGLPPEIILPLSQHIGAPATPIVKIGDTVLKGQPVAQPEGLFSAGIHASTSGVVTAIEDRIITHPSGMSSTCIIIQPDGEDKWAELQPCDNYLEHDKHALLEQIQHAGIVGMGGAGFPTSIKVNPKSNRQVTTLILNGTECEPYITADDVLMRERANEILLGAQLLCYLLGDIKEVLVGIEDNKPEAIAAMQKAAKELDDSRIHVVKFPTKYPSGGEKQLIQILTGKEVPSGGLPAQLGIVVQNVGTTYAAYRAVKYGEPLISRVTTVVGQTLQQQRNVDVLLGTPISFVLEQHGFKSEKHQRLIIGGPMMGFAAEQETVPVVKTTNCILAPTENELPLPPPAQACIRCGICAEACPASLLPQQLYWYSRSENHEQLEQHNLFDCIECGACSYVCPSNIPLVQYYRASKGAIKHQREEKEKSDRSRERFEQRQERILRAEAEKEAKRQARKKAAEEAKKIAAAKKNAPTTANETVSTPKPVTEKIVDPTIQKAKLERSLSSAQSRLERANLQLQTNINEEQGSRKEALSAKIKQAELKVDEAQKKLEAFNNNADSTHIAVQAPKEPALEKLALSPIEKQQKTISSLEKRLAVAKTKQQEALENNAPQAQALTLGVEKLEEKYKQAKQALLELNHSSNANMPVSVSADVNDAALNAIKKAKAKAEAAANMTDEQKHQEQIKSLEKRVEKAKARLDKARVEKDENIGAFESAYEKLKAKQATLTINH